MTFRVTTEAVLSTVPRWYVASAAPPDSLVEYASPYEHMVMDFSGVQRELILALGTVERE